MKDTTYRISDTALASYLIVQQFYLQGIDYSLARYEFSFADLPELRTAVNSFLTGNSSVNPSHYLRIYRKLSRVIRNQQQWEDD